MPWGFVPRARPTAAAGDGQHGDGQHRDGQQGNPTVHEATPRAHALASHGHDHLVLVVAVVCFIGFGLAQRDFWRPGNVLDIATQIAVIATVAFAMTAVIVACGIDLSVGSTLAFSGIIGGLALNAHLPGLLALVAVVWAAAALGAVNGFLISVIGISPFMATLATLALGRGLALSLSNAQSITVADPVMLWPGAGQVGPIPAPALVALASFAILWFALHRLVFGRWIYAAGGNATAARASLIPVRRTQFCTYVIAGAAAGIGSVLTIGRVGSAQPLAGQGLEFAAITAAVIGGTKLSGGEGSVLGTLYGALLMGIISTGLSFLGVSQEIIYIVTGGLVVAAVLFSQELSLRTLLTRLRSMAMSLHTHGGPAVATTQHTLRLVNVGKSFPGVRALDAITFGIASGEVVALLGENGAGKSTLARILAGVHPPDVGHLQIDGREVRLRTPEQARRAGISVIHQHFSLLPSLTVTENLFLGREVRWARTGLLRRRAMRRQARDLLDDLGLDIDAGAPLTSLGVGQRQMIEIAKALLSDAWLIVMDEPTSALSLRERDHLFTLVRRLTSRGVAILYISHKMDEVYALASRAVVLRDGRYVGGAPLPGTGAAELIRMMVGRQIETVFPYVPSTVGAVALHVTSLSDGGLLKSATFAVHYGELVVLAGLMGSGRTEVLRCIAGLSPIKAGQVALGGDVRDGRSALDTMDLAFVPEDRHAEGFIPAMSVEDNLALVWMRDHSPAGLIPMRRQGQMAEEMIQRLNVRPPARRRLARLLSGGNQQKVVVGKWLVTDPKIVLLDEPTRGVDVGAKAELHTLIAQLKTQGIAILMVSSELPEVLGVADRIVVMHQGRTVAELSHGATEEEVMRYAFGQRMAEPRVRVGT